MRPRGERCASCSTSRTPARNASSWATRAAGVATRPASTTPATSGSCDKSRSRNRHSAHAAQTTRIARKTPITRAARPRSARVLCRAPGRSAAWTASLQWPRKRARSRLAGPAFAAALARSARLLAAITPPIGRAAASARSHFRIDNAGLLRARASTKATRASRASRSQSCGTFLRRASVSKAATRVRAIAASSRGSGFFSLSARLARSNRGCASAASTSACIGAGPGGSKTPFTACPQPPIFAAAPRRPRSAWNLRGYSPPPNTSQPR